MRNKKNEEQMQPVRKKPPKSLCCLTVTERFHLTSSCCSCLPLRPSVYLLTVVNIQPAAGGEWT